MKNVKFCKYIITNENFLLKGLGANFANELMSSLALMRQQVCQEKLIVLVRIVIATPIELELLNFVEYHTVKGAA